MKKKRDTTKPLHRSRIGRTDSIRNRQIWKSNKLIFTTCITPEIYLLLIWASHRLEISPSNIICKTLASVFASEIGKMNEFIADLRKQGKSDAEVLLALRHELEE